MRRFVTPLISSVFDESFQEYELFSTLLTIIVVMNYSVHDGMKMRSVFFCVYL